MSVIVTQKKFGEMVGISQSAVSDLLMRGVLADGATAGDWVRAYSAHLRLQAAGQTAGLLAERERLSRERADHAALKNAQLRGELVNAERVRHAITTLAATARSGFDRVPDKLAERLAVLTDAHECHALIATEIDQVLTDLAAGAAMLKLDDATVLPAPTFENEVPNNQS